KQQMRRDVALAHEAVDVQTFLNFEVEPPRRRLRRGSCHWPREPANDNSYLCVRNRPSGELHFTPCASLGTERARIVARLSHPACLTLRLPAKDVGMKRIGLALQIGRASCRDRVWI